MSNCKCSGNNSLHYGIGGFRCACGGTIDTNQILRRVFSRIEDLEERESNLIQGLVAADMGECGCCGQWFKEKELVRAGDRATCDRCFTPEYFLREEDDDETVEHVLPELMRNIVHGRFNAYWQKPYLDILPREASGKLTEPFLTEYRKHQT